MKQGDQPEDDPRDEEERLLIRHWDLPSTSGVAHRTCIGFRVDEIDLLRTSTVIRG